MNVSINFAPPGFSPSNSKRIVVFLIFSSLLPPSPSGSMMDCLKRRPLRNSIHSSSCGRVDTWYCSSCSTVDPYSISQSSLRVPFSCTAINESLHEFISTFFISPMNIISAFCSILLRSSLPFFTTYPQLFVRYSKSRHLIQNRSDLRNFSRISLINGVKRVITVSKSLNASGIIMQITISSMTLPVRRAFVIPNCVAVSDSPSLIPWWGIRCRTELR
mmetsp:Transcript_19838/g.33388  ORF Transcript_19838/g.33388 Transcript_19838/m.33388 type:complete len:218 (+) Transcript_19838:312-965(+)